MKLREVEELDADDRATEAMQHTIYTHGKSHWLDCMKLYMASQLKFINSTARDWGFSAQRRPMMFSRKTSDQDTKEP